MSKMQRAKGAIFERDVCTYLSKALGRSVKRNIGQARDGGDDITLPPYRIECKRRASLGTVYGWLEQARAACAAGEVPLVIARGDAGRMIVVQYLDDAIGDIVLNVDGPSILERASAPDETYIPDTENAAIEGGSWETPTGETT